MLLGKSPRVLEEWSNVTSWGVGEPLLYLFTHGVPKRYRRKC